MTRPLVCGHCGSTREPQHNRHDGRTIVICRDCAHYVTEPSTEQARAAYEQPTKRGAA